VLCRVAARHRDFLENCEVLVISNDTREDLAARWRP
jgi:hypothetical protein